MSRNLEPEARRGLAGRIWRSIFRGPLVPVNDRERRWVVLQHLLLHFRPVRLPKATLAYTHTFGLGGTSLVLLGLLAASGALLLFVYLPSPETAHQSLQTLRSELLFGGFVRNLHYWSANLLLVAMTLHLLRVFLTGAFHPPRQFNWEIGLALLLTALASSFTGYLLPWDQLSYWAVTICLGMLDYLPGIGRWLQGVLRGGSEVGSTTLLRFYALHTTVLPALLVVLSAFHFWRVRKAGGVVPPRGRGADDGERVLALPHLLLRETAVALLVVALVSWLAALFEAPLGEPANPGMSPNPAKAPWYFLGFQELLLHLDPFFAVVLAPAAVLAGLAAIPYLPRHADGEGVWLVSRRGRRLAALGALGGLALTALWVVLDEERSAGSATVIDSLLPVLALVAVLVGFHLGSRRWLAASAAETRLATFVLLAVGFAALTLTGMFLRGRGMALVWPGGAG